MELATYVTSFINETNRNLFLTGKAGTGKTTLLQKIVASTHKNTMVVAPTGIAALNAKGVTIHSLFQLPFASFLPTSATPPMVESNLRFENRQSLQKHFRMHRNKRRLIENLELLVVDEVSMLRADVLDAMDFMLKSVRKNQLPFGGVQMLFIGDLLQLPPVVKNEEWDTLKNYYSGIFFFHAKVIEQNPLLYVELDKVYRQSDTVFLSILNNLRHNQVVPEDVQILNQYVNSNFKPSPTQKYITLTTHNAKADKINNEALAEIKEKEFEYQADIVDDFPEYIFPLEKTLRLKKGAQIMFIKNDLSPEKRFFNGKLGTITNLSQEEILVELADDGSVIEVQKYEWQNVRYYSDAQTGQIKEEVLGTFTHYPIRTAWAITVHKSQGLTFDKAILDIGSVFAPGQAYVALSRLRSLDGLVLLSPISGNNLQTSSDVEEYSKNRASREILSSTLSNDKKMFMEQYVLNTFQWEKTANKWRQHLNSYKGENERSNKNKYRNWATKQSQKWEEILSFSLKFTKQLQQIFTQKNYNLSFLLERYEKAQAYFFPILNEIEYQTLQTLAEISSLKNVKQFREELTELDEYQTANILQLFKTEALLKSIEQEKTFEKNSDLLHKINSYKTNLLEKIYHELNLKKLQLQDDSLIKQLKKDKEEKLSTYEKTWILWQKKLSVEAIASERKLSATTVYGHIGILIKEGKININEILSEEVITELSQIFAQVSTETTLSQIKEQVGDKYSWEVLRMFRNSIT